MKVLISAYACEPSRGSEPEVGWRWSQEMGRYHDVIVLTRANNRKVIEEYIREHPEFSGRVRFMYFDLSKRMMRLKKCFRAHEIYYMLWQRKARKVIDQLIEKESIDLVHLVTFASFRYPVFLSKLKVPVVWGPVGGAEIAPWRLLGYRMRFPACVKEVVRNVATGLSELAVRWINPTRTSGGAVIASTPRTQKVLRAKGIEATLMPAIGVDVAEPLTNTIPLNQDGGIRFIFVGRLVLLKGVHLLLDAFAKAEIDGSHLTIVGDGSERRYLERLTEELGLNNKVTFMGQVTKGELPLLYAQHHIVVGPSLYESGGYMVLEGFMQKRPAIVLNVGGLAMSVDANCGIKVEQGAANNVVAEIAQAMRRYARQPELIEKHGAQGYDKLCSVYTWDKKSEIMAGLYQEALMSDNNYSK